MTRFNSNGAVSEIYVKFNDPDMLSKLAFHECMHNKLRKSAELHGPSDRPCEGLHCANLGAQSRLLPENINDMAAALLKPAKQWAGVLALLVTARALRDALDPFWDRNLQW